mmetsp:Transcript_2541/g.5028  ORF Transcript_2541/g.5028 Transcript_2541/m.5028 type:complete len:157 (-) Transcript_2541:47-517(-)
MVCYYDRYTSKNTRPFQSWHRKLLATKSLPNVWRIITSSVFHGRQSKMQKKIHDHFLTNHLSLLDIRYCRQFFTVVFCYRNMVFSYLLLPPYCSLSLSLALVYCAVSSSYFSSGIACKPRNGAHVGCTFLGTNLVAFDASSNNEGHRGFIRRFIPT